MRLIRVAFIAALVLSGCSAAQLATDGQLFCSIAKSDGTAAVVSVINATAPGAVVVTGIASAVVAAECNQAASVAGGVSGTPVPPAVPTAAVAIVPPKQTPAGSS